MDPTITGPFLSRSADANYLRKRRRDNILAVVLLAIVMLAAFVGKWVAGGLGASLPGLIFMCIAGVLVTVAPVVILNKKLVRLDLLITLDHLFIIRFNTLHELNYSDWRLVRDFALVFCDLFACRLAILRERRFRPIVRYARSPCTVRQMVRNRRR